MPAHDRCLAILAGAKALVEQALHSDLATYGPDHPDVATDRNNLGSVLRHLGDLAGTRREFEQAQTIYRQHDRKKDIANAEASLRLLNEDET